MHGNVKAALEKTKIMAETLPEVWLCRAVDAVPLLLQPMTHAWLPQLKKYKN